MNTPPDAPKAVGATTNAHLPPPPNARIADDAIHHLPLPTSQFPTALGHHTSKSASLSVAPPQQQLDGGITIQRCELMWSTWNSSRGEPFTPVANCPVTPVVIMSLGNERFDDDDLGSHGHTLSVHYRWRRGPARAVCFFHPNATANLQCSVTLRCFCSHDCFKRGQVQLRRFYLSKGACPIPRQHNEFSYGVPCEKFNEDTRDPDPTHYSLLRSAGLVINADREAWTTVAYTREYTPNPADMGHQLSFEVFVFVSENPPMGLTLPWKMSHSQNPGDPEVEARRKEESATLWMTLDNAAITAAHAEGTYRRLLTGCVICQPPSVPPRTLLPLGWIPQEFWPGNQRCIVLGTPLAEALGITQKPERGNHHRLMLHPRPFGGPGAPHIGGKNTSADAIALKVMHQTADKVRSMIRSKRCALLTEQAFSSWAANSSNPNIMSPLTNPLPNSNVPLWPSDLAGGGKSQQQQHQPVANWPLDRNTPSLQLWAARGINLSPSQHHHLTMQAQRSRERGRIIYNSPAGEVAPSSTDPEGVNSFTIMTWNVLADIYATQEAYPYAVPYVLAWNYRRERILNEIMTYNPDIICLQEIQGDHFEDFFAPALLRRGYEGLYKQKTSRVFRGSGKHRGGKYVCDGCATFFRVPKFQLVDHFGIEFARVAPPPIGRATTHSKADKRLNKDNVALVLCLEHVRTPQTSAATKQRLQRKLVVANAHILANPGAPDVKIWQANTLTSVLTEYIEKTMQFSSAIGLAPGLIVCGDFNSMPTSAVYQLMVSGKCEADHPEIEASEACRWLNDIQLGHGLNLRSSYGLATFTRLHSAGALPKSDKPPAGSQHAMSSFEPEFTNYTHSYVGCLDYIFYDDKTLDVTGTLELVREVQLIQEAHSLQLSDWALPSPQRPSDHLPLLTRFEWVNEPHANTSSIHH